MPHLPQNIGCKTDDCDGHTYAKGLCRTHYNRQFYRYTPRLSDGRVSKFRSAKANLEARSDRDPLTGCLVWRGVTDQCGYGRYGARKKAHRVAYEDAHGPIPKGMCVCHRCDNPRCCEIDHLFLGTQQDNTADRVLKGRCAFAKLTREQVIAIRIDQRSRTEVANDYGVSITTIRRICNGKSWRFAA